MMNKSAKYAVDTCSFTALRRLYPMDIFPGVWEFIDEMVESGLILSSEEIYIEITAIDDEVLDWAKHHKNIFYPIDESIQDWVTKILGSHPNFLDIKKKKSSGDPFLVATAIVHSCSVVTEEKPTNTGSSKIKIPDICKIYNISCIALLEMLRNEGLRLERGALNPL